MGKPGGEWGGRASDTTACVITCLTWSLWKHDLVLTCPSLQGPKREVLHICLITPWSVWRCKLLFCVVCPFPVPHDGAFLPCKIPGDLSSSVWQWLTAVQLEQSRVSLTSWVSAVSSASARPLMCREAQPWSQVLTQSPGPSQQTSWNQMFWGGNKQGWGRVLQDIRHKRGREMLLLL